MNGEIKRYIAYKISAGLIARGQPQLEKDKDDPTRERFHFLTLKDKEINRINLIANVIDKFKSEEKAYITLTLDDGSGHIRVRAFSDNTKLLENIQTGDTILVIGTLRHFNNELYILPEIVRLLDAKWLVVRKLELEKEYGNLYTSQQEQEHLEVKEEPKEETKSVAETIKQEQSKPESTELSLRKQIIEIIKQAEDDEGIDIDRVIMQLSSHAVDEINKEITSLLEEGTIYEPRPGRLRIL